MDDGPSGRRVVPFGNPRIKGHLLLPAAYRSLSRPSSPPRAQASAMCPFLLSLSPWPAPTPAGIIYFRLDFSFLSYLCFLLLVHNVIDRTPLTRKMWRTVESHHASCSLPLLCEASDKQESSKSTRQEPKRHAGRPLQKGGVPAAPSGTATLLRLSPNHRIYPRALLAVTHFRHPRLSWLDGRCVQGPGTYSPRHG